jgi:2-haloacid dehalogenase
MTPLDQISHLTFDCYGTLIDWERGILAATQPVLARLGASVSPEAILRSYVQHEARLEAQGWRAYREVLAGVMIALAGDFGVPLPEAQSGTLASSLPLWPPFPDTEAALERLSTRFRLVILSNTDDSLFAETQKRLPVPFATVITAEQVKSYKPGPAHFHEALRRLEVPAARILHVAQSLYHDHVPARQLGFNTAWVNRPSLLPGTGLAPTASVRPDLVVPDLATLAAQLVPDTDQ